MDGYVELLRDALAPRLAELGLEPLPPAGWMWGDGRPARRFAVALTHDLDNLWRWTRARLRRRRLPHRPRAPGTAMAPRRRRELGDVRRLADAPPAAPHRPLLDVPADPRAARTCAASPRPST